MMSADVIDGPPEFAESTRSDFRIGSSLSEPPARLGKLLARQDTGSGHAKMGRPTPLTAERSPRPRKRVVRGEVWPGIASFVRTRKGQNDHLREVHYT